MSVAEFAVEIKNYIINEWEHRDKVISVIIEPDEELLDNYKIVVTFDVEVRNRVELYEDLLHKIYDKFGDRLEIWDIILTYW